jgi:HlyD family secretion protein
MNRRIKISLLAGGAPVLVVALAFFVRSAKPTAPHVELIDGTVECDEIDVSSKVPGRIGKMMVDEGDPVRPGDLLVTLESQELDAKVSRAQGVFEAALSRQAQAEAALKLQRLTFADQLEQAEAGHRAAQSRLQMALNGPRAQEIEQAERALDAAAANYETQSATYRRFHGLFREGVIPEQTENEYELRYRSAKAQRGAAEARLRMLKEGTRGEEIEQARQGAHGAQATLELARDTRLQVDIREQELAMATHQAQAAKGQLDEAVALQAETRLISPVEGYVSQKISNAGDMVSAGFPTLTLVKRMDFKVKVYADESRFGHLALNHSVRVVIPALANAEVPGKIIRISQAAEFATKKATNEQGSYDVRGVQIVVLVTGNNPRLRNGMTARVKLDYEAR